ncbi:MAG: hypothetical protein OSB19_06585 [Opitutaceae bacterium]|nr:hypothetical protein [Opitutaceae bacterium]
MQSPIRKKNLRLSKEERAEILAAYRESGMTQKSFAESWGAEYGHLSQLALRFRRAGWPGGRIYRGRRERAGRRGRHASLSRGDDVHYSDFRANVTTSKSNAYR